MDQEVIKFLSSHTCAVLAVGMPDGSVHAMTLHFAENLEATEFYFSTKNDSKKYDAVKNGSAKASVVVGVSDETWKSLQMDGEVVEVTNKGELEKLKKVFYTKLPNDKNYACKETVYLKFVPKWWRYSDYSSRPPKILPADSC